MKISKTIALVMFSIALLALAVASQISQVTDKISVEEVKTCNTVFYDEVQNIYGKCIYYYNYTSCLNTSGKNTDCSINQKAFNFTCKTGEVIVNKNKTDCQPPSKFIVFVTKGTATEKKEIDFSSWGPCIYSTENSCLIVTCQSIYDGANDGQFHGCKGGTSCQKFQICDDKIKVFYKNSREDFVEYDPTFYLSKLALKEVTK